MHRRVILILLVPILGMITVAAAVAAWFRTVQIDSVAGLEAIIGPVADITRIEPVMNALQLPLGILYVGAVFIAAYIVSRLSYRFSGWLLTAASAATYSSDKATHTSEQEAAISARRLTMQQLVASIISLTAFSMASIIALGQFVSLTNLAILATVLANAFGFAARDYVGDLLNGISNLFEDNFDVGDNLEIVRPEDEIRGIVEQVNIRTLGLRTRSGELVIVPQGQVRILRNFTRGVFTGTDVTVSVAAPDLVQAMQILVDLGQEAPDLLSDLVEPWRVVSREGDVNAVSQLKIYAKAAYGRGAQLRLQIMTLVQQRLAAAGIPLA